jgi:hypothetical protein
LPSEYPSGLVVLDDASVALEQTSTPDTIMDNATVYSPIDISV